MNECVNQLTCPVMYVSEHRLPKLSLVLVSCEDVTGHLWGCRWCLFTFVKMSHVAGDDITCIDVICSLESRATSNVSRS